MEIDNVLAQDAAKLSVAKVKMDTDPTETVFHSKSPKKTVQAIQKNEDLVKPNEQNAVSDKSIELDAEKMEELVGAFNNFMLAFDQKFKFSVYEETNQVWVRITDAESEQVIREVPAEETLQLAAKIRDFVGLLVDKKA